MAKNKKNGMLIVVGLVVVVLFFMFKGDTEGNNNGGTITPNCEWVSNEPTSLGGLKQSIDLWTFNDGLTSLECQGDKCAWIFRDEEATQREGRDIKSILTLEGIFNNCNEMLEFGDRSKVEKINGKQIYQDIDFMWCGGKDDNFLLVTSDKGLVDMYFEEYYTEVCT